jgi:hypothetical protein
MGQDSSKMAAVAWIGAVLLPTSMVATIMGAVRDGEETVGKVVKVLGILFAVSIPFTIALVLAYQNLIIPRSRKRVEFGNTGDSIWLKPR